MAYYAYEDARRTKLVYARDCTAAEEGKRFYCRNPECNAIMQLKARESKMRPYFSAMAGSAHAADWCGSNSDELDETKYVESEFDFASALEKLTQKEKRIGERHKKHPAHPEGTGQERPLHTIRQILAMCQSRSPEDTYNGMEIRKMLVDERSNYYYTKGIWGYHLVEGKFWKYNRHTQIIFLKYPYNKVGKNKYILSLHFPDEKLFKDIKDKLFHVQGPVVVAGLWGKISNNIMQVEIISSKQLWWYICRS